MRCIDVGIAHEIVRQQRRVVIDDHAVDEQAAAPPGFRAAGGHEHEHHGLVGRHVKVGLPCCAPCQESIRHGVVEIERRCQPPRLIETDLRGAERIVVQIRAVGRVVVEVGGQQIELQNLLDVGGLDDRTEHAGVRAEP